jgi:hypothetical protein
VFPPAVGQVSDLVAGKIFFDVTQYLIDNKLTTKYDETKNQFTSNFFKDTYGVYMFSLYLLFDKGS